MEAAFEAARGRLATQVQSVLESGRLNVNEVRTRSTAPDLKCRHR